MNQRMNRMTGPHTVTAGDRLINASKDLWRKIDPRTKTLIQTAGFWDTWALGMDCAEFNETIPLQQWHDQLKVSFLWARIGDGRQLYKGAWDDWALYVDKRFAEYCQNAYDVNNRFGTKGIPFGGYFIFRNGAEFPLAGKAREDYQFKALLKGLENKTLGPGGSVSAIALDVELKDDTNSNISDRVNKFMNWMMDDPFVGKAKIYLYTNMYMLTTVSPNLGVWVGQANSWVNLWMAQWMRNPGYTITPATLMANYPAVNQRVLTPGNHPGWEFYQGYGDVQGLQTGHAVDLDWFKGTEAALWQKLGYVGHGSVTPPPPPPPPVPVPDDLKVISDKVTSLETWRSAVGTWGSGLPK